VHLYGQLRDPLAWQTLCREANIAFIEDCAQAHGAALGGRAAGSYGVAAAFSFYPTKNLGAAGDGGMLVTTDAALAERGAVLRNYGQSERYHHPVLGLNSRLDEMHAAMLSARLPWLAEFTQRRRAIADAYRAGLRHPAVHLLALPQEATAHVHHLFVVTCAAREALQAHLRERGVQSLIHYPVPIHHQAPCTALRRDPQGLAASEQHAATCLSLPCHPQLGDADVQQVIDAVNRFAAAA
jgi:dTDP-4-amino-4,6-dideoxygalactose transaminase